eukprot:88073-Prorocentrum_minimum.AAC.1
MQEARVYSHEGPIKSCDAVRSARTLHFDCFLAVTCRKCRCLAVKLRLVKAHVTYLKREYTRIGHQSQKGKENIPVSGTNRRREKRIYLYRAPIAEGKREYTRNGHQSQKGNENIPVAGTNHRREKRIYP